MFFFLCMYLCFTLFVFDLVISHGILEAYFFFLCRSVKFCEFAIRLFSLRESMTITWNFGRIHRANIANRECQQYFSFIYHLARPGKHLPRIPTEWVAASVGIKSCRIEYVADCFGVISITILNDTLLIFHRCAVQTPFGLEMNLTCSLATGQITQFNK